VRLPIVRRHSDVLTWQVTFSLHLHAHAQHVTTYSQHGLNSTLDTGWALSRCQTRLATSRQHLQYT